MKSTRRSIDALLPGNPIHQTFKEKCMAIIELQDEVDAEERLGTFFPNVAPEEYVRLLMLLHNKKQFSEGLKEISRQIWIAYNDPRNASAPNRFTRSIIDVANSDFGFSCQENVVLTAPADSAAFGQRIKDRVIWKDSFAAGHGEFAHSYQWLVAGHVLNWGVKTGAIYEATAGVRSTVPLFVRDTGGMVIRPAQLWEFLVDCTLYKETQFDAEADKAIPVWIDRQLDNWSAKKPTSSWFVDAFFRGYPGETADPYLRFFDDVGFRHKADYLEWQKRRGEGAALKDEVIRNSDVKGFHKKLFQLYPKRNALTRDTFRSANNVTTLSSQSHDFFVSIYDNYRNMVLLRKQNERLRLSVIQQLGHVGLTKAFFERHDPQLTRMFEALVEHLIDAGVVNNSKAGGTTLDSPNYHGVLVKAGRDAARALGYQPAQVKEVENLIQRTLHPIQVRKSERKDHYAGATGFKSAPDDPSIFHKTISTSRLDKATMPASFHEIQGTVNIKVYQNQLIK